MLAAVFAVLVAACGGDSSACVEGTAQPCACSGGLTGVQTCSPSGAFEPCVCDGVDSGAPDDATVPDDAGMMMGSGESVTRTIGPEGGTLELTRMTLTIPPGAVATPTQITVTETTRATPAGFTAYSPLYEFLPAGLSFATPATLEMEYVGDATLAGLFMTHPESVGWERLGGLPRDTVVSAEIGHFSEGFIADSVDYTDPPDLSCVETRLLRGQQVTPPDAPTLGPSAISLLFSAQDCWGRPVTGLAAADIQLLEAPGHPGMDFEVVSSEASARLLPREGVHVVLTLLIDMSSSTAPVLPDVMDGIEALLNRLEGLPVHVGVQLFSGAAGLDEWEPHRLDDDPDDGVAFAALRARLSELASYVPTDPSSTNLNGAVIDSLEQLTTVQRSVGRTAHGEEGFTTGYVLLFTDGRDTARARSATELASAIAAERFPTSQLIAVGLDGADFDRDALVTIAGGGAIIAPAPATLRREFANLAVRIAGQTSRTFSVGYCSPARSGSGAITVAVEVAGASTHRERAEMPFNAQSFGPGCDASFITSACEAVECGGFGCGACDVRTDTCVIGEGEVSTCESNCDLLPACGNETIVNGAGYSQQCTGPASIARCAGECRDLETNIRSCGACDNECVAGGFTCRSGACACLGANEMECRPGECHDVLSNPERCGACDNICSAGSGCTAGACDPFVQLAAGHRNSCGVRSSGKLLCWGENSSGWIRALTGDVASPSPMYAPAERILDSRSIAVGGEHVCLVTASGEVYCSGSNTEGQVGDGTAIGTTSTSPSRVGTIADAAQISTGRVHTCVVHATGAVSCWGRNGSGELGDGTTVGSSAPVPAAGVSDAVQVEVALGATCARRSGGEITCWGGAPAVVSPPNDATDFCLGSSHVCVVRAGGGIVCWGDNAAGQLGNGTNVASSTPVAVSGITDAVSVGCGAATCALRADGVVSCWGPNRFGQFGTGLGGESNVPVDAVDGFRATILAVGAEHNIAVSTSGEAMGWGANHGRQLGVGTTRTFELLPVPLRRDISL